MKEEYVIENLDLDIPLIFEDNPPKVEKKKLSKKIERVLEILCNSETSIQTYEYVYFDNNRYNHCFIGREVIDWCFEYCHQLFEEYKKPKRTPSKNGMHNFKNKTYLTEMNHEEELDKENDKIQEEEIEFFDYNNMPEEIPANKEKDDNKIIEDETDTEDEIEAFLKQEQKNNQMAKKFYGKEDHDGDNYVHKSRKIEENEEVKNINRLKMTDNQLGMSPNTNRILYNYKSVTDYSTAFPNFAKKNGRVPSKPKFSITPVPNSPLKKSEDEEDEIEKLLKEKYTHQSQKKFIEFRKTNNAKKRKLIDIVIQKYTNQTSSFEKKMSVQSLEELQKHVYLTNEERRYEERLPPNLLKKRLKIIQLFDILFRLGVISSVDQKFNCFFLPSSFSFYFFCHLNVENSLLLQSKLITIVERMKKEISVKDRRWRLSVYKNCFISQDAIKWITENIPNIKTKIDAVNFGRLLESFGLVSHVVHDHKFKDGYFFYRFLPRILHSGFLFFREKSTDKFERRWFVLREDVLLCFEDIDHEKPIKSLPLFNISISTFQNLEKNFRLKNDSKERDDENVYHFYVANPSFLYFFATPFERERDVWISRLFPLNPVLNEENNIFHLIETQIVAETFNKFTSD